MVDWKHISLEQLAAFLSDELRNRGINTVLVGGACVTIYSKNRYQSYDLDFATYEDMRKVKKVMAKLGFYLKGRHFAHKGCPWFVEFVAPPIAVGGQPIERFKDKKSSLGTIRMLRPEDSVKDRLASYFYWNDRQGLRQALNICLEQKINMKELRVWAEQEGQLKKFEEFQKKLTTDLDGKSCS